MARKKEFDPGVALERAIGVFADHGFEGTSTDDLLQAMAISRQSLYDTFGDKRQLYLAALRHYNTQNVTNLICTLNSAASPLKGVEAALLKFTNIPENGTYSGCMGVSAVCEFGQSDGEISAMTDAMSLALIAALERRLTDAQVMGEIAADLNVTDAAYFLSATLSGIKVFARAGAAPDKLRAIAVMAIRSMK